MQFIKSNYKTSPNVLVKLQSKRLAKMNLTSPMKVEFDFMKAADKVWNFNYLDYPFATRRIIKKLIIPGKFYGLALHSYYSLELSRKTKLINWNFYTTKLQVKPDTRFFYGLIISWKLNYLATTITIWNVFYNEIMEKTFPLFSVRNTLVSDLSSFWIKHFLSTFLRNIKNKKKFFNIWNHPRSTSRVTLSNLI